MASANNMVSPIHNWRSPEPWAPNGSHPKAHSADFIAKSKQDVNNVEMQPEVYHIVYKAVPSVNNIHRPAEAPKVFAHPWDEIEHNKKSGSFAQHQDIANKEIRPDVYHAVKNLLPAIPERVRMADAPKVFDHPWDEIEYNKKVADQEQLDEQKKQEKAVEEARKKAEEEKAKENEKEE